MKNVHLVQIIIGFLGFGLVISTFWLGDHFNWSFEVEIFVALTTAIATIMFELVLSFSALKESLVRLYPSLDYSVSEQKNVYALISDLLTLRKSKAHPFSALALENHKKSKETIRRAVEKSDYNIENMFEANLVALKMLKPGEHWLGLSSIINPDYWKYDSHLKEYRDLNYKQVENGVIIRRIFLLSSVLEYEMMEPVMREQMENGIDVHFTMPEDIKDLSFFPDITLFPEHKFGMYTPSKDKLLICIATVNPRILDQIQNDFEKILDRATKYTVSK